MQLPKDWSEILKNEYTKPYYQVLKQFVDYEYANYTCYPPQSYIFKALHDCAFDDVKVVIIGQDPYHGFGQANGLCFSVNDGVKLPPSLVNILKELESDLEIPIAISGNLERWAKQGVLMLNAVLSVRESAAGSHQNKGWECFTDAIISEISIRKKGVVFLLWGSYAHKKGKIINRDIHLVLESGHPSPLSANRGYWFGNKHFSSANTYLKKQFNQYIEW